MPDEIVNRVANSPLITFDLGEFYPDYAIKELDIAPWRFHSLLLREKEFRAHVKAHNWEQYRNCGVAIYCSADAIIPHWAYMLIAAELQGIAREFSVGSVEDLVTQAFRKAFDQHTFNQYEGKPVVVKGCGDKEVSAAVYAEVAARLLAHVKVLSFGEACSTVPIAKKK